MEAVPVLAEAVKEWKKKASADKTWTNFKTHFKDELKMMKTGNQKLASLGLVNEVQELKKPAYSICGKRQRTYSGNQFTLPGGIRWISGNGK